MTPVYGARARNMAVSSRATASRCGGQRWRSSAAPRGRQRRSPSLRRQRGSPARAARRRWPAGPCLGGPDGSSADARRCRIIGLVQIPTLRQPMPASPHPEVLSSMSASTRPQVAAKRYVYTFGAGEAEGDGTMRDLLGGKGAGLAEMTKAGLPVPPGFTITTEACNDYFAAGEHAARRACGRTSKAAVAQVEAADRQGLRRRRANPLLVCVRSGAKFSMPGMMDTVLNLGLNEETVQGLIKLTGNERFAWDAYRRFIQMFGRIVLGVDGERIRRRPRRRQGARRRRAGHRRRRRRACRRVCARPQGASSRTRPARASRRTRTSSSTWPSRPSSPAGSASAPATTATTRRSPTTWAPRSTS